MAKANGKTPFLDRKLKRVPSTGLGYATSTLPLSEPDTAREALETLKKVSREWLHAVSIAATSDARDVIPGACMDLNEFIETTIEAVLTGTWRCGTEDHEHSWKELQAAGEAVTLDEGNWEDWMNLEAARTLFKAANRGRELMASRAAEGTATLNQTQH